MARQHRPDYLVPLIEWNRRYN